MYWHPEATARAVADAGLRATIGAPLFDLDGVPSSCARRPGADLEALAGLGPTITPALAPHAIYTVSEESLRWIAELSAERGLPIQIHLSETEKEVQDCLAAHGERPAFYLDRLGLLSERTVLAHGVWLDPDELALIAERGATVVTNPVANMKLAVGGVFPHPAARAAGVPVGLGTDGAGSNDSLDLLADLKVFALAQKHAAADPTAIDAAEAWAVATGARAPRARRDRARARRPRRFPPPPPRLAGAGDRRADRRPRLCRLWLGRRNHGRRRPRPDARRDGPRAEEIVARAAERAEKLGLVSDRHAASSVRYEESDEGLPRLLRARRRRRQPHPGGPRGRDLRPRRALGLRQDDGDADGQPHGRDQLGRRPHRR